jgi:hypothetical protein
VPGWAIPALRREMKKFDKKVMQIFRDPDGDILVCDDDSLLEAWYEFIVTFE